MKSILLTKPLLDSLYIRDILKRHGYKIYIESIINIKYLHSEIPIDDFDIIISTSKNCIKALGNTHEMPIITVGNSAMQAAKDLGFSNIILADSNVNNLILFMKTHYSRETKFLYIRGQEASYDLKKKLSDEDFNIKEMIVYKTTIKRNLTNRCKTLLLDGKINGVIFFSTQAARIFSSLILKSELSHVMTNIVAYTMNKSIADSLKLIKWKKVLISKLATQESLIDIIHKNH